MIVIQTFLYYARFHFITADINILNIPTILNRLFVQFHSSNKNYVLE